MGLCLYMSPDSLYENNIFFSGYSQNIHIKVLTSLVLIAVDHRKLWFESWPGPCPDGPLGNFCSSSHHVKWSENHQAWISGKPIKLSLMAGLRGSVGLCTCIIPGGWGNLAAAGSHWFNFFLARKRWKVEAYFEALFYVAPSNMN